MPLAAVNSTTAIAFTACVPLASAIALKRYQPRFYYNPHKTTHAIAFKYPPTIVKPPAATVTPVSLIKESPAPTPATASETRT